jgi:hypothetical protein
MIRLQEPELKSTEDHAAWQSTWNDDERMLAHFPPGYWQDLVEIAQIKRLLSNEMPPDLRLRFLKTMNDRAHGILTVEALQRVEPACDTAMQMLDRMKALSDSDRRRLLQRWNVMAAFIKLNPSILEAIRLCSSSYVAAINRGRHLEAAT